jgi:hypothetical protein
MKGLVECKVRARNIPVPVRASLSVKFAIVEMDTFPVAEDLLRRI